MASVMNFRTWRKQVLGLPKSIRQQLPLFSHPFLQLLNVNTNRIVFFLISVYLPFPTFVYVKKRKKRMAEHRSLRN